MGPFRETAKPEPRKFSFKEYAWIFPLSGVITGVVTTISILHLWSFILAAGFCLATVFLSISFLALIVALFDKELIDMRNDAIGLFIGFVSPVLGAMIFGCFFIFGLTLPVLPTIVISLTASMIGWTIFAVSKALEEQND